VREEAIRKIAVINTDANQERVFRYSPCCQPAGRGAVSAFSANDFKLTRLIIVSPCVGGKAK
jgi:hypothetical protein